MANRTIRIYSSLEEQKEAEIAYAISISPEQRIKEAVMMIKKLYGIEDGRKYECSKKIKIIQAEKLY